MAKVVELGTTAAEVSPSGASQGTAAQISSPGNMGTLPGAIGPLAAPQPEVNLIPQTVPADQVSNEQAPQASNLPSVTPFNVDNFYPLYSQINYNVVT